MKRFTRVPLQYAAEIDPSKGRLRRLDPELDVTFIPMELVGFGGILASGEVRRLGDVIDGYTYLRDGDVAFAKISPSFQNGKGGIAAGFVNSVALATTELTVLRPSPGLDQRFLSYVLQSVDFVQAGTATLYGVAGQQRVNPNFVRSYPVPLPPIEEQRRIADYLDTETARIDSISGKLDRLVVLAEERHAAGLWQELHGTRVAGSRVELDSPWFPDRPSTWDQAKLGLAFRLQRGHDLPDSARVRGPVPVVSSGGITGTHDVASERGPGVVTGRYGTVGEVYYVDEDYWPLNTALFVKRFNLVTPRYAYWLLRGIPLTFDSNKSAVTGINRNVLHDIMIPVPPRDEQERICARLDAASARLVQLRAASARQRRLLAERRQALITSAVTGELEV